jgi:4-hydroxybenzoate polyprenyltransferase/phosphoserine phosphatase
MSAHASAPAAKLELPPLVVDLDGTLLHSDMLLETGLQFLRQQPWQALRPLRWLLAGKVRLKQELAQRSAIDVTTLPYNQAVLALLQAERARGRRIVLATASHMLLARRIADHLQLFDEVLASEHEVNLSAQRKRDCLLQRFGARGFDYMGNSRDDLPVWGAARLAYVVNASGAVSARAHANGNVAACMPAAALSLRVLRKALRLHQWAKNFLIFLPLLAAHVALQPARLLPALLAFLCFSLCASSVYLLNDLLDLQDDRQHQSKRLRPCASGQLPLAAGVLGAPLLLAAAALLAAWLPWQFGAVLAGYYALTLAYSLSFKRVMALDIITLAMLYTLRLVAGAKAVQVALTFWMLAFSMALFLSLALVKRYAELREARQRASLAPVPGRGYGPDDLEMIASLGAAAGYMAVLVLGLYTQDHATVALYRQPQLIWLACPLLLFWVTRTWLLTHRGQMHDDPVVFAIKDKTSLLVAAGLALIFWAAA